MLEKRGTASFGKLRGGETDDDRAWPPIKRHREPRVGVNYDPLRKQLAKICGSVSVLWRGGRCCLGSLVHAPKLWRPISGAPSHADPNIH